jgi:hypothetical protein
LVKLLALSHRHRAAVGIGLKPVVGRPIPAAISNWHRANSCGIMARNPGRHGFAAHISAAPLFPHHRLQENGYGAGG